MDFNNYENETFDTIPSQIEGSNFSHCTFKVVQNTTFLKCNIDECVFETVSAFRLSNIYYTEETQLPDGCIFDKCNLVNKDEPDPEVT